MDNDKDENAESFNDAHWFTTLDDDDDDEYQRLILLFAVKKCVEDLKLQGYEFNDDSKQYCRHIILLYMCKCMENELQKFNDYYDMEEKDEERNFFQKIFKLKELSYENWKVILETIVKEQGEKEKLYFTSKNLPLPQLNVQTNLFTRNDEEINQLRSFLRENNRQIKELKHELFQQKDKSFDKPSSSKNSSSGSSTEIYPGDKNIESVINEFKDQIKHLKHSLILKEGDISEINWQISSKDREIETLKNEKNQLQNSLQVKERNITEINEQMNSKDQEIATLKNDKSQLQNSLQVKERNITKINGQMNSKDQEIATLKNDKSQLQNSLQVKERNNADINGQIKSKDQEIVSLKEELREAEDSISAPMNPNVQTTDMSWVIRRSEITDYGNVLGNGGWGEVQEAKFRGTKVAVKKLHNIILSPYNQKQFEREIIIAMRVRHPNIVQFMGATDDDKEMLYVMELLQKDLRSLLENKALEGSFLPEQQILQIVFDVIRALVYLHQSYPQIIHRDISSANVLLYETKQGWRGKLSDYGSANLVAKSRTQNPGAAIYSAPEAGDKNQNQSLDVYSFGVLFCEMLTKEMPDPAKRQAQVKKIANKDHRFLVTQCIKSKAKQRPNSMDVLKQIDKWVTDKSYNSPVQLRRSLGETSGRQSLPRWRSMVELPSISQDSERRSFVADIANSLQRLNPTRGSMRGPPTKRKPNKK